MASNNIILVAGASGLIGGHLVAKLVSNGHDVRAVGKSSLSQWQQLSEGAENISADLMLKESCFQVMEGVSAVYNLAAEIGGVNFIEHQKAQTMLSVLINTHLLMAARHFAVKHYFYASTQAVAAIETPQQGMALVNVIQDGHIWEKLFSEKLCAYYHEDFGLPTRIGRLQNVYGDFDRYDGGRERAPAALCRKAISAKASGDYSLEIWGNGTQMRSFMAVDDVVDGILKLSASDIAQPVRLCGGEYVSINQLVDVVEKIAGISFNRHYNTTAPSGIERAQIEQSAADKALGWTPKVTLEDGMRKMYRWIESDMRKKGRI